MKQAGTDQNGPLIPNPLLARIGQQLRRCWPRPTTCLLCGGGCLPSPALAVPTALCAGCAADLPWLTQACCPRCASPSPAAAVCGACLKRPPAFDQTHAVLAYRFPLDRMIPRFKYHGALAIGPVLAACLAHGLQSLRSVDTVPDVLIPMPAHRARLAERGFHHAHEIARGLGQLWRIPVDTQRCQRVRNTPPQMRLRFDARRRSVRDAFACTGDLTGARIALVDDVMTTGTSLDEVARTLKQAGAQHVQCWIVARALREP